MATNRTSLPITRGAFSDGSSNWLVTCLKPKVYGELIKIAEENAKERYNSNTRMAGVILTEK